MKVSVAYWGRVYETVMYKGWVTLETPVDVSKVIEAKSAVENELSRTYLEGVLDSDSMVTGTPDREWITVECTITVLECRLCGCLGHAANDCVGLR